MNKKIKLSILCFLLVILFFVVVALILQNTKIKASYTDHMAEVSKMYQTSTKENDQNYIGVLSGIRTGGRRDISNLTANEFECVDNGVYFNATQMHAFYNVDESPTSIGGTFLFFADHNSDTFIKLCGRPDCSHDTDQCNAFLMNALGITYYDGHLYFATVELAQNGIAALYRMDMDGSNRVKILDCTAVNDGTYSSFWDPQFINGVFMMGMGRIDETTGEVVDDWFYCKLDENSPKLKKAATGFCWTDGEAFLHGATTRNDDGVITEWQLVQWDPNTNTEQVLNTLSGIDNLEELKARAQWGETCGLVHLNGKVTKINYPNSEMEVLFETGITGETRTDFYPDCIAIFEKGDYRSKKNGVLHFYDYQGNKLGQVEMDIPTNSDMLPIVGESRDRIYVRGNQWLSIPSHYIDKSEFGTGSIELHPLEYPDLKTLEKEFLFSDQDMIQEMYELYSGENYGKIE